MLLAPVLGSWMLVASAGPPGAAPAPARFVSVTGGAFERAPRDTLVLEPGGVAVLDVNGAHVHCVHLGRQPGRYRLGTDDAPLRPLTDDEAWTCRREKESDRTPATDGSATVFVLGLEGRGVPASTTSLLGDLVAARLADHQGLSVLSGTDVKDMLTLEAERAASGCEDTSCLAELAGALGARYVVSGQVADEDGVLRLALTLFDTGAARVVGRAEVRGRDLEDLGSRVHAAVHNLLAEHLGLQTLPVPELRAGRRVLDGGALGAASVAGAAPCLAGLGCLTVPPLVFALLVPLLIADPILPVLFGAPLCCSAAPCLAAPVGAELGDRVLGFSSSIWRTLLVTATVVPVWTFMLVVTSAAALVAAALADTGGGGALSSSSAIAGLVTAGIGMGLASAAVLATGFVAHEVGIALFADAPALDDATHGDEGPSAQIDDDALPWRQAAMGY